MSVPGGPWSSTVVVAVDVGKTSFAVSVTAADHRRMFGSVEVAMRVLGELAAWAAHRARRVATRTRRRTSCSGQLDRAFPGLTLVLPDVVATKAGRLVARHFADPARLAALGPARLIRFAAARGLQLRRPLADRLAAAARDALSTRDAAVARQVLATELGRSPG